MLPVVLVLVVVSLFLIGKKSTRVFGLFGLAVLAVLAPAVLAVLELIAVFALLFSKFRKRSSHHAVQKLD